MNKPTQALVVGLLGGVLLAVTVSGSYTSYVRPGLGPLLLAAGGILVVVAVLSLITSVRAERTGRADGADHAGHDLHGHTHDRSRAPWLILAPALVLLVVAPPALGAAAVARTAGSQLLDGPVGGLPAAGSSAPTGDGTADAVSGDSGGYAFNDGSGVGIGTKNFAKKRNLKDYPALPAGAAPAIGIKELVLRALYDANDSVAQHPVTITAFVAPTGDGYTGGYSLARLVVSCCAADATPMQVHVTTPAPLPSDTWVSAVVLVRDDTATAADNYVPTVTVSSVTRVAAPADPYEH